MGTSFTRYRGCGFWTTDAALETVLALLVLELEPLARQDPDLDPILDTWTVQSVAGFGGCVSAGLDEHLTSQPGLAGLTRAKQQQGKARTMNGSLVAERAACDVLRAPGRRRWTGGRLETRVAQSASASPSCPCAWQLCQPAGYAAWLSIRSVTSPSCVRNCRS